MTVNIAGSGDIDFRGVADKLKARIAGAGDIRVVAAWDIDRRKVGQDVAQAIFTAPNCTAVFAADVPETGAVVSMGRLLDGVAEHMDDHPDARTFVPADAAQPSREEVVAALREGWVTFLPVGVVVAVAMAKAVARVVAASRRVRRWPMQQPARTPHPRRPLLLPHRQR